ncbi:leucyl/phenylalanyl-tRNA--protein transferase [Solitalea koreensis]|uniref:Leucyl/phenylalanyl-tRNA--protein transferase n=1 Tax=Solitalea koreensis TaxID=543615 RepID=A0A521AQT3_9SPHI|nr:leucyl/phenylalanyl-tRNA--protein transferase [Solitalea koreensis]SMO37168.1 leucyl/phenylalanyl-tRNA--protein transferase [Solitalea koreensis]
MPIFQLTDDIIFPHPLLADENGVLAIGGDLSPERLLLAYQNGIFPWFSEGEPIIWHAPDPRCVLYPEKLKISKSMKQVLQSGKFRVTVDEDFKAVINNCQKVFRKDQPDTWITNAMHEAYIEMHELGFAHSVEVWQEDELVGGLYGINLGTVFFGESMFHKVSNASKVAFITLVKAFPFSIIDCQMETAHLKSLGAENIPLSYFLKLLNKEVDKHSVMTR